MISIVHKLSIEEQISLFKSLKEVTNVAPFFDKFMPYSGQRFNYRCTSAGKYGWYSDRKFGYRYETRHPHTKLPFPEIPNEVLSIVDKCKLITDEVDFKPETCLINVYNSTSTLGIHQDNTERNLNPMIISISLGEDVIFEHSPANQGRTAKKDSILLKSGDVLVFSGEDRLCWHGVPNPPIIGTMPKQLPIKKGYRLNLTIRQVD